MIRATLVRLSAALWGLATAISLLPSLSTPATPEQLPGLATLLNINAHAPMRFIAALILLPVIFAAAAAPLSRAMATARSWSRNALCIVMTSSLWIATVHADVWWTTIPIALFVVAFVILRNVDAHFTRHDVILVPVFLSLLIAFTDLIPSRGLDLYVLAAVALTLTLRLIARDAERFTFAPLALIAQTPFLSWDQRHLGWPSIAIVILAVCIPRRMHSLKLRKLLIYPLAAYCYTTAISLPAAEGKPRANIFEDAHGLLPASQMLRGEKPYRDVIPGHGLLEDGLLDYLALRSRDTTYGHALKTRATIGALNSIAIYALATAATGSPEAGFLAFLFGAITGSSPPTTRTIPALFALALIVAAVRRRKPRLLFGAGLLAVVAGVTSLDFAAYTFITLVVAIFRFRPRAAALRAAAVGIAVGVTILAISLASFGILGAFIRTTFVEIPSLGPAYAMNPFTAPAAFKTLRYFPEVIAAFFDRGAYLYLIWIGALLLVAMTITTRARRRIEPLVLIALWITLCAISYAERHHLHFQFAVAPLLIVATFTLFRARQRVAAVALTATLFVIAQPTTHLAVLSMLRHAHGPLDDSLIELGLPRARGAYFTKSDAAAIDSVKRYAESSLAPSETFFDFTNRGLFYFLLDRDSPIRQIEVPQYETAALQREVIERLERNPHVRAALVPANATASTVDGVPNELRAPLVWQYLQTHFEPAFAEGEVVIWRRK